MERTLILIKPDAVQRDLIGEILTRFERKGLKVVGLKMIALTEELLNTHYGHLSHLPFFPEIVGFMRRTPVVACCLEGTDCVDAVRLLCGITKAREAAPGTIRGDFGMSVQANLVHASDSVETAKTEIDRFFKAEELFEYEDVLLPYLYSPKEAES